MSACPHCGAAAPESGRLCASCGWDFVAQKLAVKPPLAPLINTAPQEAPGLELLFSSSDPSAPKPAAERETPFAPVRPVDMAPPPPPPPPEIAKAPEPVEFPSTVVNSLLEYLERTEGGRAALDNPLVQTVVTALRDKRVFIATVSVLGVWFVGTMWLLLPSWTPALKPRVEAPVESGEYSRPTATFGAAPKVLVTAQYPSATPAPSPAPVPPPAPVLAPVPVADAGRGAPSPVKPPWIFEGTIFDLLTTSPVFAAKLTFMDPGGKVLGTTDTDTKGRYKITIPSETGVTLKIMHADYTGRYIDDDGTSSLRRTTPGEREIPMKSGSHNLPWIGDAQKAVRRDLALVPRASGTP